MISLAAVPARTVPLAEFETLSLDARLAVSRAEDALAAIFPKGTRGSAIVRPGQVHPSPAVVRGVDGYRGYLVIALDSHRPYSRNAVRSVHYTDFVIDPR